MEDVKSMTFYQFHFMLLDEKTIKNTGRTYNNFREAIAASRKRKEARRGKDDRAR